MFEGERAHVWKGSKAGGEGGEFFDAGGSDKVIFLNPEPGSQGLVI